MAMESDLIVAVHSLCTPCLTSVQTLRLLGAAAPAGARCPVPPADIYEQMKGAVR